MKVVIIEDEPLMAIDMANTLQQLDPAIVVSATLPSIRQASVYFASNDLPDLIFSDIQLGDGLSFELFSRQAIHAPVVFCTAYDEYALQAFKANAIDYILKPFTNASLYDTLQKYKNLQQQFAWAGSHYRQLADLFQKPNKSAVLVFQNERIVPVPFASIAVLFIHKKTAQAVCFDGQVYTLPQTLDELSASCGDGFYRASRQYLVNRKAIKEAYHYYGRKLLLRLAIPFKDSITVSKDKYAHFLQWLSD